MTDVGAPRDRSTRLLPTRRLAFLLFAAAALAVAAPHVPWVRLALFGVDGLLVLGVLVDVLLTIGPRVEVDRRAAGIFSVGRANVVTLQLRSRSWRTVRGTVADDPLEACVAVGNPAPVEIPPRGVASVRYECIPSRRGARELDAVTVRYASPLGLVARQDRARLPAKVDVYPDVHAARALELLRRQGRQGPGSGRFACVEARPSSSASGRTSAVTRSGTSTGARALAATTSQCAGFRPNRTRTSSSPSTWGAGCGGRPVASRRSTGR